MSSTAKIAPPGGYRASPEAVTRVAMWVAVLCLLYALPALGDRLARRLVPTAAPGGRADADRPGIRCDSYGAGRSGLRDQNANPTIARHPVAQGALVLQIPRRTLDLVVLGGVDRDQLRQGPGLLPGTPAPGLPGNSVIAAHRTTWGAPFGRLDELRPGDLILAGPAGDLVAYTVVPLDGNAATDGHRIVTPSDGSATDCSGAFRTREGATGGLRPARGGMLTARRLPDRWG